MTGPRLLIRLGSMGDVVLATAAANALRETEGDGAVDVLVKEEWAGIWQGHPAVREVLPLSWEDRDLGGIRRWARRLRGRGYVETVDLQAISFTRLLTLMAGLSPVRRPRRRRLRRRALVTWKRWGPSPEFSVGESFVEAIRPGSRALPSVHPGAEARRRAAELMAAAGPVGLVPGARYMTKRWPRERFVEVGRRLAATGRGPVPVFFGPDEDDLLRAWGELWPETGGWIALREDLPVVAACFERLSRLVGNDTGLIHLAAAVGTPVVALFGPTVRSFGFAPLGPGHQVLEVEELGCRPCSLHGGPRCPQDHFRCMLEIDASRVIEAAERPLPAPERAVSP
jgi:heptosyltransferase-2